MRDLVAHVLYFSLDLLYPKVPTDSAVLQIVSRESARFGLPGDRENIVQLKADHSGVCRFDRSQVDRDNFELVQSNIKDLYKSSLRIGELRDILTSSGHMHDREQTAQDWSLEVRLKRLRES